MFELIGVPPQALFGQLLLGLINGAFYALLSLGLAVIFGLMNVINFTHGAQYMMGAFASWMLLQYLGIPYWGALVLAPLIVGATGIVIERLFISRLYHLDHLYGLLLTFGLALIIEGLFRQQYGSSGLPYANPIPGGTNLGFMFLPWYRAWVIVFSLVVCLGTWFMIEKTKLGSYLRAATERPDLVQAFGINVPRMITLTYGFGVGPGGARRRAGGADLLGQPGDGLQPDHRRVRRGGDRRHGLDHGLDRHRLRARRHRGPDQGVLSGSLQHRDLHHHGDRADAAAAGPVRDAQVEARMETTQQPRHCSCSPRLVALRAGGAAVRSIPCS